MIALAAGDRTKASQHLAKSTEQNARATNEDTLARGELTRLRAP